MSDIAAANIPLLQLASKYRDAGLSVIPVRCDGSKAPAKQGWRRFSDRLPGDGDLKAWFVPGCRVGIGITCGRASGNLEVLDIERAELFELWSEALEDRWPGLLERLPVVRTGSGGYHVYYRHDQVEGGRKLAVTADRKTLIETRGHGHQVIAPGSPAEVHPRKRLYEHVAGPPIEKTPTISASERQGILDTAREFTQVESAHETADQPVAVQEIGFMEQADAPSLDMRPGDDFNARASWADVLTPHGWEKVSEKNGVAHWRRPGKDNGWSATTNYGGKDLLIVFSENAQPFRATSTDARQGYKKFSAFALLKHAGNFARAAKDLVDRGYGGQLARRQEPTEGGGDRPVDPARCSARSGRSSRATKLVEPAPDAGPPQLPKVHLPGGPVTVIESASRLGELLAATRKHFNRGGVVVSLDHGQEGDADHEKVPVLKGMKPAAMPAEFETVAQLWQYVKTQRGFKEKRAVCSEQTAKIIISSRPFLDALPPIHVVSPCPVLIERDDQLVQITGYDREAGILAAGRPVPALALDVAGELLDELLSDFRFATPSDRSRALAAIITPALVLGDLLGGRAPVDLGEADASQAGKGYRNKLTAAIYGNRVMAVTQRKGGVGSLEESFSRALIAGANFICLDNIRGRIDSPAVESFLTEDWFAAREPYGQIVEIDPRRTIVMITSNKAEITRDLANRSCAVRLLKQPVEYSFRRHEEGDLLDHVRATWERYLGAVFAVVHAWHAAGKPRSAECGHDFRAWAQTLDWIVQKLLGAAPLIDGHSEAVRRMTNPALTWLRDVALAVIRADRALEHLRVFQLFDIIETEPDIEMPGAKEDADLDSEQVPDEVFRAMGRRLRQCFREEDTVEIDGLTVTRHKTTDEKGRQRSEYTFENAVSSHSPHSPVSTPQFPALSRIPRMDPNTENTEHTSVARDNSSLVTDAGHAGQCGKSGLIGGKLGGNGGSVQDQDGGDDWGEV